MCIRDSSGKEFNSLECELYEGAAERDARNITRVMYDSGGGPGNSLTIQGVQDYNLYHDKGYLPLKVTNSSNSPFQYNYCNSQIWKPEIIGKKIPDGTKGAGSIIVNSRETVWCFAKADCSGSSLQLSTPA